MSKRRAIDGLTDDRRVGYVYVGTAPVDWLSCKSCGVAIALGELCARDRISAGNQFFHLACTVAYNGYAATALLRDPAVAAHVRAARVEDPATARILHDRLAHHDRQHALDTPITVQPLGGDPRIAELLDALEQRPEDRATLAVLGDLLREKGDPRGELITLQLGATDSAMFTRRDRLLAALAPPGAFRTTWGIGFLRTLGLDVGGAGPAAPALHHDSARLITELELSMLTTATVDALFPLPRSVRMLTVIHRHEFVPRLVAGLPHLDRLRLRMGNVTTEVVAELAAALAGRRLARIGIDADLVAPSARRVLAPFADDLAIDEITEVVQWVEHVKKPEWGRGRIVREFDGKLEIEFAHGTVIIKASSPLLRR